MILQLPYHTHLEKSLRHTRKISQTSRHEVKCALAPNWPTIFALRLSCTSSDKKREGRHDPSSPPLFLSDHVAKELRSISILHPRNVLVEYTSSSRQRLLSSNSTLSRRNLSMLLRSPAPSRDCSLFIASKPGSSSIEVQYFPSSDFARPRRLQSGCQCDSSSLEHFGSPKGLTPKHFAETATWHLP